jgi:hypothetical protein
MNIYIESGTMKSSIFSIKEVWKDARHMFTKTTKVNVFPL